MPNELEEMARECIDHASEFSDREAQYQNLKKKIVEKLRQVREKTILEFYSDVCKRAEDNMLKTGKLEGAHYAAMKSIIEEMKIRKLGGGK